MSRRPLHAINWFEIPVTDFTRAQQFYSEIFAYNMPVHEADGKKMGFLPFKQGSVGGTIVEDSNHLPAQHGVLIYLNAGNNLVHVLDRVVQAGGKVIRGKNKINEQIGFVAEFEDSEGNRLALHSPV